MPKIINSCCPIENPPWANKIIKNNKALIAQTVSSEWIPSNLLELGCGHYGCVYSTHDDEVVFKITSDSTEAEFIQLAAPWGWPEGIVKYHKIVKLDGTYRGRQTYGIWREAAIEVGLNPFRFMDGYERSNATIFSWNLTKFQQHAKRLKQYFKLPGTRAERLEKVKKLENWAWKSIHLDDAKGMRGLSLHYFIFPKIESLKGEFLAAASLRACEIIAEQMGSSLMSDLVGEALQFYLEHNIVIGDLHTNNVGKVDRYNESWVITDPGHIIVL